MAMIVGSDVGMRVARAPIGSQIIGHLRSEVGDRRAEIREAAHRRAGVEIVLGRCIQDLERFRLFLAV